MGSVGTLTAPPTPVQRPPEKPVQRTAHTSAVGHGLGVGGNAVLWAFGTYGWGTAAAIGGVTAAGLGLKHLRNRRRGGRGGGLLGRGGGRGGLLGRLGGRGRSGGGLGLGGGRGRSGGLGSRSGRSGGAGGFLRKLAGNRSSSPRSGGGLLGRGAGGRGPLGRGKGKGLLGGRGGAGSRPGSSRGRGGGLLGGSRGTRGSGGRGLGGGRSLGGSGGGKRRGGGLLSRLNPFSRNHRGSRAGGAIGRGIKNGAKGLLGWLNPFGRKKKPPRTKKQRQLGDGEPSGWTEVPLNPNTTKWTDITMAGPKTPPRRSPAPQTAGSGGGRGLTAAAEQFAGALAKPPTEVDTLKKFDQDLGDLAGAISALQGGMKNHTAVVTAGMPAEVAAHQELSRYTQQIGQIAEGLKVLQADQRRRLHQDHERVDNGRPNERGYDWQNNQQ